MWLITRSVRLVERDDSESVGNVSSLETLPCGEDAVVPLRAFGR